MAANFNDDGEIMVRVAFKASQYETVEKVKRYIELEGIPLSSKYEGNTLLHVAVKGGNIDVANYILQIGKKKYVKDLKERLLDAKNSPEGDTALSIAIQNSHWALCSILLKNGCNPCISNATGKSTLHYYVERILFEEHQEPLCKEIWKTILTEHQNQLLINIPTVKERGFNTAIHLSARKMKLFLCRDLLNCGADALQLNSDFQSFVHIALSRKLNQQQTEELYQLINEIVKDDPKKTLGLLYIRDINRKSVFLLTKEFGSQTLSNLFVKYRKELPQTLLHSYAALLDQFFFTLPPSLQDIIQNPVTSNVLEFLRKENGFVTVINRFVDDFHQLFSAASTFYDMVAYSEPKKCLNDYRKIIRGLRDLICNIIPPNASKDSITREDILAELYYNVLNDVLYIIRDKNHISDMIIGLKYNQKVNPASLNSEIAEFFNEENLPLWDYPIKLMELVTTSRHPRDKICNLRAASDEIRRVVSTFKAPEEDVLMPTFNYTFLLAKVPYPKSELFLLSEIWDANMEKALTQWEIAIDYLISYGFGQDGSVVPPAQQHVEEFKCLINHLNSIGAKDDLNLLAMIIYYLVNTPTVCIPGRQFSDNTMNIVADWMKRRGIELCYDKIFKGIRVDQIKPVLSSGDYCEMLSAFEST